MKHPHYYFVVEYKNIGLVTGKIISVWNVEKPVEFFKLFEKFIPMTKFQNSRLWDQIVEIKAKELSLEIRGIK